MKYSHPSGLLYVGIMVIILNATSVKVYAQKYNPTIQSLQSEPIIPDSIRVGYVDYGDPNDPNDDTCSFSGNLLVDCDAGSKEDILFEDYLISVVASEMAATWGKFDSPHIITPSDNNAGLNALKAQAIAARSYAINYSLSTVSAQNPQGIICNTSQCQRFNPSLVSTINKSDSSGSYFPAVQAVLETSNFVLVDARSGKGGIAPGYYAASTNSSGSAGSYELCPGGNGYTGDPGFADGSGDYFYDQTRTIPVEGFPCHPDDALKPNGDTLNVVPNKGHDRFGHGAGMSQTGALRWAVGTEWNPHHNPKDTLDFVWDYYNSNRDTTVFASASDIGVKIDDFRDFTKEHLKDWRQILMHYYVFPFVSHASEPGQEQRWYQLSVADIANNESDTTNRIPLEAGVWEGSEVTLLSDVHVKIGETSSDSLRLEADESGRPSYLICKEGSSVQFSGTVIGISPQVEATCTGQAGKTASMRLNQGGLFKADDACLQAGTYANVTIAAGKTVDFEDGGFLSNQGGTFTLEDNAIISIASTAGAPEVNAGSSFTLGDNSKLKFYRDTVIGEEGGDTVTIDGGDIDIFDGHVEFWNTTFDTDDIIIHNGGNASFYGDNIVISSNFEARLGSTFRAGPDETYFPSEANREREDRLVFEPEKEAEEDSATEASQEEESYSKTIDDDSIEIESYPNPFNPTTTIRYRLEADAFVTLKVYNMLGQEVNTLVSDFQAKGVWESRWNGQDNAGTPVASGIYIYHLSAGDVTYTGKMILIK